MSVGPRWSRVEFATSKGHHVPVPRQLSGLGFFPGGSGWIGEARSRAEVMIVGQDFGTIEYFRKVQRQTDGEPESGPTWRPLLALLDDVGIPRAECYFTNALLGLRASPPMTGESPGWRDKVLVECSMESLAHQITILQPRVILTLGLPSARAMGRLAPEEFAGWQAAATWAQLDLAGPVKKSVSPLAHRAGVPSVAALVHPSYRKRNVRLRRYRGREGEPAEREIIADVLR